MVLVDAAALQEWLAAGDPLRLLDVRTGCEATLPPALP